MKLFKKKQKYGFFKSKKNWSQVIKLCTGYDDPRIAQSTLKKSMDYTPSSDDLLPYAIICQLIQIAKDKAELNVVDFGGCFGKLYKQVLKFLPDIKINWSVVEQESYVNLVDNLHDLNFYTSLEQVSKPDLIIASGVLQYLENPQSIIKKIISIEPEYIIIDRLPVFTKKNRKNTIAIQKVPIEIYGFDVSYPCWISNEENILLNFSQYEKISRFFSHQDCRNNIIIDKSSVDMIGVCFKKK